MLIKSNIILRKVVEFFLFEKSIIFVCFLKPLTNYEERKQWRFVDNRIFQGKH